MYIFQRQFQFDEVEIHKVMCSTKIGVSERETTGSRSNFYFLVLIALSCVAFIFVVIGLSLGGNDIYSGPNGNIEPVSGFAPFTISFDLNNDELVPEQCEKKDIDVEAGWIGVAHCEIPDILPLCVDQAELDTWYMIFATCGGYEPVGGTAQLIPIELPAEDHCDLDCCCCGVEYYIATFELAEDCICLDANHLPTNPEVDESIGDCFDSNCWITTDPDKTLQKEVDLVMWQDWEGCEQPDQSFKVILAHKSCIENSPKLYAHRQ